MCCRIEDLKSEIKNLRIELEDKDTVREKLERKVRVLNEDVVKVNEEKERQEKVLSLD